MSKEKPPPVNKQENAGTLNILNPLANGISSKQKIPADGVHRIRVDFKVKSLVIMPFQQYDLKGVC